jgi:hypothetical protein
MLARGTFQSINSDLIIHGHRNFSGQHITEGQSIKQSDKQSREPTEGR